jgi:8-oxo-dGTP pyrophosphatase MutT (NUDIX family)
MKWAVHGERSLYSSPWLSLSLVEVEPPGVEPFEHHVVRYPGPAAAVVTAVEGRGVLLLWRHRFTTDTWGWEIPAGRVDEGAEQAARREMIEETGWAPGNLEHLVTFNPANGSTDLRFVIFGCRTAEHVGDPTDLTEAERIEWVTSAEARKLLLEGAVPDGLSLAALSYAFLAGFLTA